MGLKLALTLNMLCYNYPVTYSEITYAEDAVNKNSLASGNGPQRVPEPLIFTEKSQRTAFGLNLHQQMLQAHFSQLSVLHLNQQLKDLL
jgi:hypothetical protein